MSLDLLFHFFYGREILLKVISGNSDGLVKSVERPLHLGVVLRFADKETDSRLVVLLCLRSLSTAVT